MNKKIITDDMLEECGLIYSISTVGNISMSKALKSDDRDKWIDAMGKELENLMEHETWGKEMFKLISKDDNRKIIKAIWALTIKRGGRYKARLVARGDKQPEDTFNETFASTLSYESLRSIMSRATRKNFHVAFMDTSSAYFNVKINTDKYIHLPEQTPFIDVKDSEEHTKFGYKPLK